MTADREDTAMTDLITRLKRLSGDNPVQSVKLKPEDWPELEKLIEDALIYRDLANS